MDVTVTGTTSTPPDSGSSSSGTSGGSSSSGTSSGNSSSGTSGGSSSSGTSGGSSSSGTSSGNSSGSGAFGANPSGNGNGGSSSSGTSGGNSSSGTNNTSGNSGGTNSTSDGGSTPADSGDSPAAPESPPFTDIAGLWAEDYIRTAAARNLFQGYPDGTFRPSNRLSRAQFMMVLWNLAGRPAPPETSPFTDMDGQIENFRKAVAWAYSKGYVNGTSPTTFSPGEPLTRQAAVKILFAYHGSQRGPEVMMTGVYDELFTDSGNISAWARDAMYWAVYQKILSGTSASTLEPGGTVTRAQLAAIMVRYVERFPA